MEVQPPVQDLLDRMCRSSCAVLEMFEQAHRVELSTNILDEDNQTLLGEFIVSASRDEIGQEPVVGVEYRRSEVFKWDKDASDSDLFGGLAE